MHAHVFQRGVWRDINGGVHVNARACFIFSPEQLEEEEADGEMLKLLTRTTHLRHPVRTRSTRPHGSGSVRDGEVGRR